MAGNNKLSKPGLIPLKVENQGSLITTQVNKINFTGSGVTASVGQFNDLTILITGGGGSGVSSSYALSASYAQTASYFSGSISNAISSSYALTASYWSGSILNAVSASYALTASYWSGSILNAVSSSYALTASYVETSSYAYNASNIIVYVKNQSGYPILKGMVIRITGSNNSSDIPRVITASYENDNNSANTLGIANENISNGSEGYVITEGILLGIDTNNYTSGQLIYLGPTGSITGSAPIAPLHAVRLGEVIRHQSNNGSIYVRIDNGYELGELHDVKDTTTTSSFGDLLIKSGSVWINSKSLTGSYTITGSLNTTGSIIATFITASSLTGSFTGSLFGSLLGTSSWAASASQAITSSFALNAISASYALSSSFAITSSYARTASYVNPLTQSLLVSGSTTITGSTNISGAFNLMGDINASSTTIILNSPSIALPGLAFPYTPSPTVNTVMFDASNNVLFVTSSLPGGGGSGLADRIQTGSITASVAVGSNPLYPYFFLLQSSSRELLKFTTEGVMQLEAYYTTPTAITGGFMYSASGDFFVGL